MTDKHTKGYKTPSGWIATPKGRLSYPFLFEPNPSSKTKEGKPKFTASLVLPPGADLALLREETIRAANEAYPNGLPKDKLGRPITLKSPFLDAAEKMGVEWQGWTVLRLSSVKKVGVIDATNSMVEDSSEAYAGRWASALVKAFAYDVDGNKGVAFGFGGVQLLDHDDPIGGAAVNAASQFEQATVGGGSADAMFG
jgi:hypothetical protein